MVIPIPLIRRNVILRKLQQAHAFTPGTAVTLREAGVFNPHWFPQITERMVRRGWILRTADGRYYLNG